MYVCSSVRGGGGGGGGGKRGSLLGQWGNPCCSCQFRLVSHTWPGLFLHKCFITIGRGVVCGLSIHSTLGRRASPGMDRGEV